MADTIPAGVNPIGIANTLDAQIDPATQDKQIEMITLLEDIADESFDTITATYPSNTVEVYTYTLSGATVRTMTVTYTDATKEVLSTVVKS